MTNYVAPLGKQRWSADQADIRRRVATLENRTGTFQPVARVAVADVAYAATTSDTLIAYTSITAARVVTLLAASTVPGRQLVVKDESGLASGTLTITVTPASGTIDGAASKVVNTAYGVLRVYSNGTNWFTA